MLGALCGTDAKYREIFKFKNIVHFNTALQNKYIYKKQNKKGYNLYFSSI